MNFRIAGVLILTLVCGVALGWLARSSRRARSQETAIRELPVHAAGSSQASTPDRDARAHGEPSRKSGEARVSLPMNTIAGIVKKNKFQSASFKDLGKAMNDAMTMLGIADRDQAEVLASVERAKEEVLREEKSHVKTGKVEPSRIALDLSGMGEPVQRITSGIRDSLFASLPTDIAQTLADSVNWDDYYFNHGSEEAVFTISRNRGGQLVNWFVLGNENYGTGVEKIYPDDDTPIPADEVFKEERWNGFLKGLTLVPTREK